MAEEFVDLYEELELPVESGREALRKRINERYLEAQRNLDHRHFATRVKHQQTFEVTMPMARHILLDDARRADYDAQVRAFRASQGRAVAPAPFVPAPVAAATSETRFTLRPEAPVAGVPAGASSVAPLPLETVDPEQLAREREELWKKWKSGLETVLAPEPSSSAAPQPAANPGASSAFSLSNSPSGSPSSASAAPVAVAVATPVSPKPASPPPTSPQPASAAPASPSSPAARPRVKIALDAPQEAPPSSRAGEAETLSAPELEKRRAANRRRVTDEMLVNVGLVWGCAGAALVIVPGVAALVALVGHYYPRNAAPLLHFSPNLLWGGGFLLIAGAAAFAAKSLSGAMRRKKSAQLGFLSYEELLKQRG